MDASTQCSGETGWAHALAWEMLFEFTPFVFQCDDLIPPIKAERALALQPDRGSLLADGLCFNS
jgi:hypothetical protein